VTKAYIYVFYEMFRYYCDYFKNNYVKYSSVSLIFLRHVFFATILSLLYVRTKAGILETVAQWSLLEFVLPNERDFQYQPENIVMSGIEISWDRIFVSTPRLRAGVPATLSFFPRKVPLGSSPQLQAYPSWDWHGAGKGEINCSTLISVYRSRLDRCDRLWAVDSGVITSIDDFMPVCPPKVVVFDLKTDQVVRHVTFPREVSRATFFGNKINKVATSVKDSARE